MRRIALLSLTLVLSGCGHNTWWNPPMTGGYNPNAPRGDGENMRRVMGYGSASDPLLPEAGNIWPGPLPPTPSLLDIERDTNVDMSETIPRPRGSSPPVSGQMPSLPPQTPQTSTPVAPPPMRDPSGRIIQAPSGPGVTSGGGPGYQTTTTPGGGSAIIVPNGNGTSTIIHSDGRIETVPTPR